MPSHRALALMRAVSEGFVRFDIGPDAEVGKPRCESMVAARLHPTGTGPGDRWLRDVAAYAWKTRLSTAMTTDLLADLRARAHEEAIAVFARNLKDLLLAAPAGARPTLGLDPGIRTGVKAAVIDATGKVLATATLYPFQPRMDLRGAQAKILELVKRHDIELIAIGNGTASRETGKMVEETLKALPKGTRRPTQVTVSEAGASVYSASELAAKEFPASRCVAPRRGVDRAPPPGPALRAREDRAEGHRRRAIPARRRPAAARQGARSRRRGCGERRWCRSQHRLRHAALPCRGSHAQPRCEHRRAPRSERATSAHARIC